MDASGDVTRWPGIPTHDPSVDILGIWFDQDDENLYINLEMDEYGEVATIPFAISNPSYGVNIFIDGEGNSTPCSGWGFFGVRSDMSNTRHASLAIYEPYDPSNQGCPAEHVDLEHSVEDDVVRWVVPKALVPTLVPGVQVTVARADAWSGTTWPATPGDRADEVPGRPFDIEPSSDGLDDDVARDGGRLESAETPAIGLPIVVLIVLTMARRRTSGETVPG